MKHGTRTKDLVMPRGMPARFPNLTMGTQHTDAWTARMRICTTRGCSTRYTTQPDCPQCLNPTEEL